MRDRFGKETVVVSTGLSVVLEAGDIIGEVCTRAGCVQEKSVNAYLEQSLGHVFNVRSIDCQILIGDGKINVCKIRSFLQTQLKSLCSPTAGDIREGVSIENKGYDDGLVLLDTETAVGDLKVLRSRQVVESQGAFSSLRTNACVFKGKWMYEVALETAGIQQLGWATRACNFTREEGVGDSTDSYAYDGRRVRKWSVSWHPYGQPWVPGDVIGCCIDLDRGEISFWRNGISLGIAFTEVGSGEPKLPYYPAISVSQGERCGLNFGARPFKYPVEGFSPLQVPPTVKVGELKHDVNTTAQYLLGCLQRLIQLDSKEFVASMAPVQRLKRLKPLGEYSDSVAGEICGSLRSMLSIERESSQECLFTACVEYVINGALIPFLMKLYRSEPPHDGLSVDIALNYLFSCLDCASIQNCICQIIEGLAFGCRTSPIVLPECPFTGSYPYLALACHLLRREDILISWCSSEGFEMCLEGLLSRKGPNKFDLEGLIPTVWWLGLREDFCSENNMRQTVLALSKAINKVEELQWELAHHLLVFVPTNIYPMNKGRDPSASNIIPTSGSVFMLFLKYLVSKNKGVTRNMPPPGLSDNSVLVTAYTILLRLLSEGSGSMGLKAVGKDTDVSVGFLHRGAKRSFNTRLFLNTDAYANDFARLGGTFSHLLKSQMLGPEDYEAVEWEEGCMEDCEKRITHTGKQKPCCCLGLSGTLVGCNKGPIRVLNKSFNIHANRVSQSGTTSRSEVAQRNCADDEEDKPSSSGRFESVCSSSSHSHTIKNCTKASLYDTLQEEELLDIMILLYHLGVAPNFKQASYYLQHQMQSITQLDDTDRQIRSEKTSSDLLKRLKEARALYREDLIECVRQSTWYRVSLCSEWKQRGMFATCMWTVQLLLILSQQRAMVFSFVPEYYVETLLDCFHALRRSDPSFVSPTALLQQGLSPLITFLVTHFNDPRIANSDIRDALLQSISVLVQYKEHLVAFELNAAALEVMPAALLSAFDSRFWIPVTNILLRLCKGTGFGSSKSFAHGESCSPKFQALLREKCIQDEKLFSSFLNRLFNTLNWTVTEFTISMKEMQGQTERQVSDLQQKKCAVMFELSCNLERILEFITRQLPQAFLCGPEMNLVRLCELLMFVLNHTTAETSFFDRQQSQSPFEKINRAMILAPLVGIVLNLWAVKELAPFLQHNVPQAILNADVSSVATRNFEYLVEFNWACAFKGDPSLARISELREFLCHLNEEAVSLKRRFLDDDSSAAVLELNHDNTIHGKEDICSICYASEINSVFFPCNHRSCWRCISRHLLNNQRCFFCNATVQDVRSLSVIPVAGHKQFGSSGVPPGPMGENGLVVKIDPS